MLVRRETRGIGGRGRAPGRQRPRVPWLVAAAAFLLAVAALLILASLPYPGARNPFRRKAYGSTWVYDARRAGNELSGINIGAILDFKDWNRNPSGLVLDGYDLDRIRDAGFRHLRLSVAFLGLLRETDGAYSLEPEAMGKLDWFLKAILDRGMSAHLDFHLLVPDQKRVFDSEEEKAGNEREFLAVWRLLSERYANWPPGLHFELANEPHVPIDPGLWNRYAKEALAIIRSSGGNNATREVIVGVNELQDPWNQVKAILMLELPSAEEDPNILVTFHYYQPNTFAWQGETFTPSIDGPSAAWLGNMWDNSPRQKALVRRDFDLVSNWASKHDRRVVLGEFGVSRNADIVSQVNYTSFVRQEAEKRGMVWMLWQLFADRSLGALYDESTGAFRGEILDALMPESARGGGEVADQVPPGSDLAYIDAAIAALEDPEWTVRERAVRALRSTDPRAAAAVPALAAALADPEWCIRQEAARALAALGPAAGPAALALAVPALSKALGDGEWWVRKAAAQALGGLGPSARPATAALAALLADEEWMVRKAAVQALGRVAQEDVGVQEAIRTLLDDEEALVVEAATLFIKTLDRPGMKEHMAMEKPIIVDVPLRGEWIAPNTPGSRVPSHGTSLFGETYAIDFVKVDAGDRARKAYRAPFLEYLLRGVRLEDCYGWGQEVLAPLGGEVLAAVDGIAERERVSLGGDNAYRVRATRDFMEGKGSLESIVGNYVLLKCSETVYALFAHLQRGSVLVSPGRRVVAGQALGRVGHSGNSMMPHLHMQFMDGPDYRTAKGLPFVFRSYEILKDGAWTEVREAVPRRGEVFRASRISR